LIFLAFLFFRVGIGLVGLGCGVGWLGCGGSNPRKAG
jgi:hypothetical protein